MTRILLIFALLLSGCASFEQSDAYIKGAVRDLYSPEMLKNICAAKAETPECYPRTAGGRA